MQHLFMFPICWSLSLPRLWCVLSPSSVDLLVKKSLACILHRRCLLFSSCSQWVLASTHLGIQLSFCGASLCSLAVKKQHSVDAPIGQLIVVHSILITFGFRLLSPRVLRSFPSGWFLLSPPFPLSVFWRLCGIACVRAYSPFWRLCGIACVRACV